MILLSNSIAYFLEKAFERTFAYRSMYNFTMSFAFYKKFIYRNVKNRDSYPG
jgi:hypothetical protein